MSQDFDKILESKRRYRARLAALPIEEKLRMLEDLRQRLVSIRNAETVSGATPDHDSPSAVSHSEMS